MPTSPAVAQTSITVNMAEIALLSPGQMGSAILGSCVGVAIFDPRQPLAALAHIVLPSSEGRSGAPGKFANTAIPWMVDALRARGANPAKLVCKLAGGAKMFAGSGPFQIGQQNIQSARCELDRCMIRVISEHIEGNKGRRIAFDVATGMLTIEIAGRGAETI